MTVLLRSLLKTLIQKTRLREYLSIIECSIDDLFGLTCAPSWTVLCTRNQIGGGNLPLLDGSLIGRNTSRRLARLTSLRQYTMKAWMDFGMKWGKLSEVTFL